MLAVGAPVYGGANACTPGPLNVKRLGVHVAPDVDENGTM
jgi:hypothetical protein